MKFFLLYITWLLHEFIAAVAVYIRSSQHQPFKKMSTWRNKIFFRPHPQLKSYFHLISYWGINSNFFWGGSSY